MFRLILKIFFIILIALMQFVFMPILSIKGAIPNLILIGSLIFIILDFEMDAFYLAGLGGLILDLGSPTPFGFNICMLILLTFLVRYLTKKYIPQTNYATVAILIFLATIIFALASVLILKEQITVLLLIEGIYAAGIGLILFRTLLVINKPKQMITILEQ